MNVDTGKIYSDPESIRKALARGERLVPLSPEMQAAHIGKNRKQRRIERANERRAKRKGGGFRAPV